MDNFVQWLKDPTVQLVGWTLGAVGWIVGIVSGFMQVKSYFQQQRMEGAYRTLLEQAQRDWKARYTEEQVRDLTNQIEQLQIKIAKDVPNEARRVFLEDQLHALSEAIGQSYERYVDLSKQLSERDAASDLPVPIKRSIEAAILPSYLARQRRQRSLYLLTASIFLLSLMPLVLPLFWLPLYFTIRIGNFEYPIIILGVFVACVLTCWYIARKFWGISLDRWTQQRPILFWVSLICCWIVTAPAVLLFFLVSSAWRPGRWSPDWYWGLGITVFAALLAAGTLLLTFGQRLRRILGAVKPY